jgi:hypothetical protein
MRPIDECAAVAASEFARKTMISEADKLAYTGSIRTQHFYHACEEFKLTGKPHNPPNYVILSLVHLAASFINIYSEAVILSYGCGMYDYRSSYSLTDNLNFRSDPPGYWWCALCSSHWTQSAISRSAHLLMTSLTRNMNRKRHGFRTCYANTPENSSEHCA